MTTYTHPCTHAYIHAHATTSGPETWHTLEDVPVHKRWKQESERVGASGGGGGKGGTASGSGREGKDGINSLIEILIGGDTTAVSLLSSLSLL